MKTQVWLLNILLLSSGTMLGQFPATVNNASAEKAPAPRCPEPEDKQIGQSESVPGALGNITPDPVPEKIANVLGEEAHKNLRAFPFALKMFEVDFPYSAVEEITADVQKYGAEEAVKRAFNRLPLELRGIIGVEILQRPQLCGNYISLIEAFETRGKDFDEESLEKYDHLFLQCHHATTAERARILSTFMTEVCKIITEGATAKDQAALGAQAAYADPDNLKHD